MKEALFYEKQDNNKVRCHLCHHECLIPNGARGICRVRENRDGILMSLVYACLISEAVDPIEKKPMFHFLPGSYSYSIAALGCNFKCEFCQNYRISQMSEHRDRVVGNTVTCSEIVSRAIQNKCKSISYTYTEPTVNFEFACDTAKLAHEKGLKNVFVSNGYMTRQAIDLIAPYLDAANIDLKAFGDEFYKKICGAKLENVLDTLIYMKSKGIFLEITTLLIPGLNDNPEELKKLSSFIVNSLGPGTPWHVSRFHPMYKMLTVEPTGFEQLVKARQIGLNAGLHYVFIGNVSGNEGEYTYCHVCSEILVKRIGFNVEQNKIRNGQCPKCQTPVPIIER